ncbi:NeuD/PglB/VioB family sugar acetyltransferase [Herbaspirillum sp.]|uniref:NeuD/PglB/VioB family sugar acetyltransferase n=1 Tax=Herbaspirillum sp. TaxID=1890675 RepID=UPI001B03D51B|nr:NeuD/PglB/VioB family sugar acetyltransferase [Herbaspirillum sp.]MBO9536949.1 NeuD/PglB/VioB family sugar acetyltransferase [Herbaspirillum sp.]
MNKKIFIVGAGGHAKVVFDVAVRAGFEVVAFVDDAPALSGTLCRGIPVRCGDAAVRELIEQGISCALIAIGSNAARAKVALRLENLGVRFAVAVHPAAVVDSSATIGAGSVLMAGAVVNADAVIGRHCIINTAASIDHDCRVGDVVHVAPGVRVCGDVGIGDMVLVGVGAVIVPGTTIGAAAIIGAGAAVVADVEKNTMVAGVPAVLQKRNS